VRIKRADHRYRLLVLGLFTASGFTALIYQTLWTRYFKLVFGSTSLAVTTVVCTFMAGLALGSYFFGKGVDRYPRPLRLYGMMEVAIGIYALMFPLLYWILGAFPLEIFLPGEDSFLARSLLRFLLTLVLLIVPTSLMGGTFPVICKFFLLGAKHRGVWAGRLYSLNTFGGVFGVICGGLFFPIWFGIQSSLLMAGLLNILVGVLSIGASRRIERGTGQEQKLEEIPEIAPSKHLRLLSAALLLSGLTALSYEILWVRMLGVILGSSIYAFTLILAIYLTGIALGSRLYAHYFGQGRVNVFLFAILELSIGFLALLTFPLVNELPYWTARYINPLNFSFLATQFLHSGVIGTLILTAAVMMGATIPCAIQIVTADERNLGYRLGVLYSMNTVGSIIGAFLTGFFLIPWVGINSSFLLMAVINVGVGLALVLAGDSSLRQRSFYGACGVGFSVFLLVIPPVTERSLSLGVFLNPDRYSGRLYNREVFEHLWDRDRILFYRDGLTSTVTVLEGPASRYLIVNGKTDGSNETFDMSTQTLLAYTPLMLHDNPQEVLVIGLGTGVTASSVLDFPVKAVTQIEIEAAVVEAAHYFEAENRSVLKDPKLNLVIEDGRNYLLSHQKKFDVIISEPSNPWMSGVASLFSQESFTLMKDRLDAGGIACQWFQIYSMRPEDIRMVVRTFHSVFPEVHIFQTSPGDILLLGSKDPLSIDPERIVALFDENPHMGERLQEIQLPNPLVFLEWAHRLDREGVSVFLGEGQMIHTDDRPFLELSAPRTLHESYFRGILQEFLPLMPPSLVEGYFVDQEALGRHYLDTALVSRLHKDSARESFYFKKAVLTAPEDPAVQLEIAARDFGENRVDAAIRRAEAVLRAHPQHREAAFYLARLHFVQESWEKMPELLGQLLDGSDTAAVWSRLRLAESQSQPQEQLQWLENAYQIDPESLEVLFALANYYRIQGDRLLEAKYLALLLKVEPTQYTANLRLGELALEREELQEARNQLLTAIAVQPDDPQPHVLLAQIYLALGRPEWANLEYRKSLSLR